MVSSSLAYSGVNSHLEQKVAGRLASMTRVRRHVLRSVSRTIRTSPSDGELLGRVYGFGVNA